jgi:hypothetical protein
VALLFVFDDALIPASVVNPLSEASPSIDVAINAGRAPDAGAQDDARRVRGHPPARRPDARAVEFGLPELPAQAFLFVEVLPTVQDLAGNSKESLLDTGESDLKPR